MQVNTLIFNECIRNGYSRNGGKRTWDISSPKLLYSTPELAKGFLALKKFAPYRENIINREVKLIKKYASGLLAHIREPFNLIDLGCGDGTKAEVFIKTLPSSAKVRYCPVDVNAQFVDLAEKGIKNARLPQVKAVKPIVDDFNDLGVTAGMLRTTDYQKNVLLLLGSTISNFEINDMLFQLSNDMFKGDVLIIGNGIRTGKRFVSLQKYQSPMFNRWFIHLMHGLGFEEHEVKYTARFTNSRLEMYYVLNVDKVIVHNGKKVTFRKGDEVLVAVQYKYFAQELEKFCKMYFSEGELISDKDGEYALVCCKK